MEARIPQYLHLPVQVLWFDAQEVLIMIGSLVVSVTIGGYLWIVVILGLFFFIPWKRSKPRGFLAHLVYRSGLVGLKGYPAPAAELFYE